MTLPPSVTGLVATYFGAAGGATTRYYWVRANYTEGPAVIAGPVSVVTPAALDKDHAVLINWNAAPNVLYYDVLQTTTNALPTVTATILNATNITGNGYSDFGDTLKTYTPFPAAVTGGGIQVAHARYSFAADGGAVGAIVLVETATIPKNAIIIGGTINSTTAGTSGGSATVAVGTTAGSAANSILTATAIASFSANAVLNSTATLAAPVKMSAAGNINITVATAALTAGIFEVFVYFVVAAA